jgi:hypothetical protein
MDAVMGRPVVDQPADEPNSRPGHSRRNALRPGREKRRQGARPGDAVSRKPVSALKPRERSLRPCPEVAVHRQARLGRREQELRDGDVPARGPPLQRPSAEARSPEPPERAPGQRADLSVHVETGPLLEPAQSPCRAGSVNAVDRPGIQAVRAERHLEPRDLRSSRDRPGRRSGDQAEESEDTSGASQGPGRFDANPPTPRRGTDDDRCAPTRCRVPSRGCCRTAGRRPAERARGESK